MIPPSRAETQAWTWAAVTFGVVPALMKPLPVPEGLKIAIELALLASWFFHQRITDIEVMRTGRMHPKYAVKPLKVTLTLIGLHSTLIMSVVTAVTLMGSFKVPKAVGEVLFPVFTFLVATPAPLMLFRRKYYLHVLANLPPEAREEIVKTFRRACSLDAACPPVLAVLDLTLLKRGRFSPVDVLSIVVIAGVAFVYARFRQGYLLGE